MAKARPKRWIGLTLAALALGGPGQGLAQGGNSTVYRCGDGQYSQTPCPGGQALDPGPAPTPQQQREARAAAATEARLAEQLRQERHARERAAAGQGPARIGPLPDDTRPAKPKRAPKAAHQPPRPPKATQVTKTPKPRPTPKPARQG